MAFAASLPLAFTACGPDSRSVGDACPEQPLYTWQYDGSTKTWTRLHVGDAGEPLSDPDLVAIGAAQRHCLTPGGNATTLSPNDAGTTTQVDAARD